MSRARTISIKASSRASIKVNESFYTVEYSEERVLPEDYTDDELIEERANLWETCNTEVDNQIADIINIYKK